MNSETEVRRTYVRRQKERRVNTFAFNSPEWIAMMQEHYVMWPKTERRKKDRRAKDRRKIDRRRALRRADQPKYSRAPYFFSTESILDEEEKQMILELFRDAD
ncbi:MULTISPECIES: hypothetical protein [Methylomonas]|uniref:hypothetical protein n=1 Tax=Methylomonas TaxID=416 RepID=UPI00123215F6|nr:hypothetical protein [Methylomonas rhizoryzae]